MSRNNLLLQKPLNSVNGVIQPPVNNTRTHPPTLHTANPGPQHSINHHNTSKHLPHPPHILLQDKHAARKPKPEPRKEPLTKERTSGMTTATTRCSSVERDKSSTLSHNHGQIFHQAWNPHQNPLSSNSLAPLSHHLTPKPVQRTTCQTFPPPKDRHKNTRTDPNHKTQQNKHRRRIRYADSRPLCFCQRILWSLSAGVWSHRG